MPKNNNDFAVVIGVSHYKGLTKLQGPGDDAQKFYDWLTGETEGSLPTENCHLILSKEDPLTPVQDGIDTAFAHILEGFRSGGKEGRRLYFYFSGHGLGIDWNETALVLPPWTDILRNYALSSSGYLKTLIQCGYFKEVFFFLDCCRNRMVGVNGAQPLFANIKPAAGTAECVSYVFSATEFDNKAFEAVIQPGNGSLLDNNRTQGLFTTSLMNGLKGAAAENGKVTTTSLTNYLKLHLPELAKSVQKIQIPRFHSESGGDDVTIIDGFKPKEISLIISFKGDKRTVILEDSDLNIIREDNTENGKWTVSVKKSSYAIYNKGEADLARSIRIDGTQNEVHYEF
ncbi:caspase family protein [Chryseobacterium foetidum]|uniref:caspase family protein n=1 Tax=Chryseobacterium foetidum TaxID=2951057 RepID=UPI0021C8EB6D|nr:caspase family protein [Chryseobacterium foetidum]